MVQFNLLPDIKMEFLKTKRTQKLITTIAAFVGAASLACLVLLFFVVNVLQKEHLKGVDKDIQNYTAQLKSNPDLPKILTVQNQLKSIPSLMDQRPVITRLAGYMSKTVPKNVTVSQMTIDFTQHTITISGGAQGIGDINKYVDTLKFTTYTTPDNSNPTKAFNNVVLTSFGTGDKNSTYAVSLSYDTAIFDSSKTPTLNVPSITTTRSALEDPVFDGTSAPNKSDKRQGQ